MASPANDQNYVFIHNQQELRFLNQFKRLCKSRQLKFHQLAKTKRRDLYKQIEAFPAYLQRDIKQLLETYDRFTDYTVEKLQKACTEGYYEYYFGKKIFVQSNEI